MNRNAACLVPSLGLPIGFVYFWSRNVTYFTGTAVLVSALTLLAACALLYCLNAFVIARLTGRFLPQRAGRLIFALLMGAEFAFGAFWLVNYHLPYQRSLWSVAALAAVALLVLVRKEKVLTVFLGALLLISGSLYVFNFTVYSAQQARLLKEIGSNVENIVFKKGRIFIFTCLNHSRILNFLKKYMALTAAAWKNSCWKTALSSRRKPTPAQDIPLNHWPSYLPAGRYPETPLPSPTRYGRFGALLGAASTIRFSGY